jgi:hypothetical protein
MKKASLSLALVAAVVAVLAAPTLSQAGGAPGPHIQFVHGAGTTPGDTPINVYIGLSPGDFFLATVGGETEVTYTDTGDLAPAPIGIVLVLLCPAVPDPPETIGGCEGPAVNGEPDQLTAPESGELVWVAGWVTPPDEIDVNAFTLDTGCTAAGAGRATFAHAAAMDDLLVFVDGARDERPPIARGEEVASPVTAGDHQVDFLTLGTEFFVLPVPSVSFPEATNTFVVAVGPGDPNPEDPEITDLRAVTLGVGVDTCPEPTTTTTSEPPPAPTVTNPPDFTG